MIRQYSAQRSRGGYNPLRVGTIPVGAIFYLQPDHWWRDRNRPNPACQNPVIVEAFLNGVMHACRRDAHTGQWRDAVIAG